MLEKDANHRIERMHVICLFEKTKQKNNNSTTGLRPIYVMFFKFLPVSFQMKINDDMWL